MGGLVAGPRGQRDHMGTEIAIALVVILVLTASSTRDAATERSGPPGTSGRGRDQTAAAETVRPLISSSRVIMSTVPWIATTAVL